MTCQNCGATGTLDNTDICTACGFFAPMESIGTPSDYFDDPWGLEEPDTEAERKEDAEGWNDGVLFEDDSACY